MQITISPKLTQVTKKSFRELFFDVTFRLWSQLNPNDVPEHDGNFEWLIREKAVCIHKNGHIGMICRHTPDSARPIFKGNITTFGSCYDTKLFAAFTLISRLFNECGVPSVKFILENQDDGNAEAFIVAEDNIECYTVLDAIMSNLITFDLSDINIVM